MQRIGLHGMEGGVMKGSEIIFASRLKKDLHIGRRPYEQQMRWTDEGAHRLAQVRVADLNGELSVQRLAALAKMPGANSSYARQAA
jgi:hypothetical protein